MTVKGSLIQPYDVVYIAWTCLVNYNYSVKLFLSKLRIMRCEDYRCLKDTVLNECVDKI